MSDHDTTDALTAFQIARRNGYRFSEKRWLESLKGERGICGDKGERGERGPRGLDGKDGKDGVSVDAGAIVSQVLARVPKARDGRDGKDAVMPDPQPWSVKFERDLRRLTMSLRIRASDGTAWRANVLRDPTGIIDEVQIAPDGV